MILVVASMEVEIEGLFGLDRSPDHWEKCKLKYTGIGRNNVNDAFASFEYGSNLEGLLSVGFVGSVDRQVKPGDLCLVKSVGSPGRSELFYPDKELWALAERSLEPKFQTCNLLTLDRTARSKEEKQALVKKDYSVIDRETYWVSEIADRENIPFLSLRVVIDGVEQELPPEICYDGDTGRVKPVKFTAWLMCNPLRAGELPRLGWNSVQARRRLGEALNDLIPALLE